MIKKLFLNNFNLNMALLNNSTAYNTDAQHIATFVLQTRFIIKFTRDGKVVNINFTVEELATQCHPKTSNKCVKDKLF